MKITMGKRLTAATATLAALTMLLAGCGGSGGKTTGSQATGSNAAEPAAGFTPDYKGAYPMPAKDKAYDNEQPANNVKDGGELHLATTYTDSWNYFSVDGNTGYMSGLWNWYMPSFYNMDLKGNITWNPDYVTKAEQTSKNPEVVTIDINPKAKFNDGTDMDWTAIKALVDVQNGKDPGYNAASTDGYKDVKSVEAGKNSKEVVITFAKQFFPWETLFSTALNPKAANPETFTKGWNDNPHNEWGAGPYKVTKADKDQAIFERNENWWGAKPKLDKITYKYMEDAATLNAFKNGELDAVTFATNNSLKTILGRKDIQIRLGYSKSTDVLMYNGKSGALKDINVREAINEALDVNTMTKVHFQGLNWTPEEAGSELFPVFQEGYENNLPDNLKNGKDLKASDKALSKAEYKKGSDGYYSKDGKVLSLRYTYFGDSPTSTAMAKAYQQMMKDAGIKITIDNRDSSKFSKTLNSGDYDILPMSWSAPSPYSQVNVSQLYGSKSASNFSFVGNSKIDKMADVPGTISDQLKAVAAANKAEAEALKLYGTRPLDVPPSFVAVKTGLANYGPNGFKGIDPVTVGWQK